MAIQAVLWFDGRADSRQMSYIKEAMRNISQQKNIDLFVCCTTIDVVKKAIDLNNRKVKYLFVTGSSMFSPIAIIPRNIYLPVPNDESLTIDFSEKFNPMLEIYEALFVGVKFGGVYYSSQLTAPKLLVLTNSDSEMVACHICDRYSYVFMAKLGFSEEKLLTIIESL